MEINNLSSVNNQQKQAIYFKINYSKENPISLNDFTKALDGLNQIYSSYVRRQLNLEDYRHLHEKYRAEDMVRELTNDQLGHFYIEEIKQGSIISVLSDPNTWIAGIGFLGSIASIISLLKNKKYESKSIISFTLLDFENTINIIQLIKNQEQSISFESEEGDEKVEISYEDRIQIEHNYDIAKDYALLLPLPDYTTSSFRRELAQIEKHQGSGQFFATIINNPIIKQLKLPVEINDYKLRDIIKRVDEREELDDFIFMVDIDLVIENHDRLHSHHHHDHHHYYPHDHHHYYPHDHYRSDNLNEMKYIIHYYYDCMNSSKSILHILDDLRE